MKRSHGKLVLPVTLSRAVALALAAYLFLPMGLDGMVLCLGGNGHVAVESVGGACCDFGARDSLNVHESDACGSCVDIPFLSVADRAASSRQVALAGHATSPVQMISAPVKLFTRDPRADTRPDSRDSPAPLVELQRSVVLLA